VKSERNNGLWRQLSAENVAAKWPAVKEAAISLVVSLQ
jgi:hypothetical protein